MVDSLRHQPLPKAFEQSNNWWKSMVSAPLIYQLRMDHNIPADRAEWWWLGIASTCTSVSTVPSDVVTMWWFSWSASAPAADESTITLLPWVAAAAPETKAKSSTTTTVRSCDGAGTVVTVLPSTWCHVSTCSYNISTVYLNLSNHSRTTEHNIPTMHHLGIITFPECNFHRNFQDYQSNPICYH